MIPGLKGLIKANYISKHLGTVREQNESLNHTFSARFHKFIYTNFIPRGSHFLPRWVQEREKKNYNKYMIHEMRGSNSYDFSLVQKKLLGIQFRPTILR